MRDLLRDERASLTAGDDTDLGDPEWYPLMQRATPLVLLLIVIAIILLKATGSDA